MGKYFHFVNITRRIESQVSLPFNFGLPWAKDLHRLEAEELCRLFQVAVEANRWSFEEQVVAIGEDGTMLFAADPYDDGGSFMERSSNDKALYSQPNKTTERPQVKEERARYVADQNLSQLRTFQDDFRLNLPTDQIGSILLWLGSYRAISIVPHPEEQKLNKAKQRK